MTSEQLRVAVTTGLAEARGHEIERLEPRVELARTSAVVKTGVQR